MKKILVTGSEGFIGKHLCKYLEKDYEVISVDRKTGREVIDLTINDLEGVDAVIHLAAQTSVWNTNDKQIELDNISAFMHIFNLCREKKIRFIFSSSSCAVNITSMYGLSKHFDEQYLKLSGYDNFVCIRLHNVYGKNSRKDTLMGTILSNDEITLWNNGQNKRHFTYVKDVCKALVKGLKIKPGFYNAYNTEEISTIEFVMEASKYKSLRTTLSPKRKERDKDMQFVDDGLENLIKSPTSVDEGIANTLASDVF